MLPHARTPETWLGFASLLPPPRTMAWPLVCLVFFTFYLYIYLSLHFRVISHLHFKHFRVGFSRQISHHIFTSGLLLNFFFIVAFRILLVTVQKYK